MLARTTSATSWLRRQPAPARSKGLSGPVVVVLAAGRADRGLAARRLAEQTLGRHERDRHDLAPCPGEPTADGRRGLMAAVAEVAWRSVAARDIVVPCPRSARRVRSRWAWATPSPRSVGARPDAAGWQSILPGHADGPALTTLRSVARELHHTPSSAPASRPARASGRAAAELYSELVALKGGETRVPAGSSPAIQRMA